MSEEGAFGLDDEALAERATVFAPDCYAGKVALVSGGAGGIGRGVAWLLARLGAHVVVAGRNRAKLDALVKAMARRGLSASREAVDICEADQVHALFEAVWSGRGRLDLLVNSAGGQFPQAAIDFSPKGWNAVIDTNLSGTWRMMQAADRLTSTRQSLAEIGLALGYESEKSFSTAFKRVMNCSPRQYGRRQGERGATGFRSAPGKEQPNAKLLSVEATDRVAVAPRGDLVTTAPV